MPSSIRKALNELPTTLDETYEWALEWIPKEKRQHAHRLFQCLVVAIRPLRVEELAEVFAIEFEADSGPSLKEGWRPESPEDAVLSACSTLIAIIEDKGSKVVQFSHFSVKEYLTSDRLRTSEVGNIRNYHISLDAAHTILARACLTVLLQLDDTVDKERLKTFPLAFYAAQHWVDHAKYGDVVSRIQDAMKQLFDPSKPYCASWTWIHEVDFWGSYYRTIDELGERPMRPKWTALYYAVQCGFSGLANYLITTHAENVNAECKSGRTPLIAASHRGIFDIAHLLLQHNADVNARNVLDWTPLHYSSTSGHARVTKLLLEHGAVVDAQDDGGETPLYRASENGHLEVVKILLGHGATVNAQGNNSCTPLYRASVNGHLEVVRILLDHGADVHIGGYGNTPFQLATRNGHAELAELLLEHAAEKE